MFSSDQVESLRTAGSLLKNLYSKQSEELKALKASYPVTFKETAELRELCRKQGEELKLSRAALPAFKSKVSTMASQIVSLRQDLAKVIISNFRSYIARLCTSSPTTEPADAYRLQQIEH